MVLITLLSIEGEPVDVIGGCSAGDPDDVVAGQRDCLLLHLRAIGQCGDGDDQDGDDDGGVKGELYILLLLYLVKQDSVNAAMED